MKVLAGLLQEALNQDRIVVMSNLRLRLGNGAVHEDTIRPLKKLKVGDAIAVQDIDRASSEALWCALTRHPDFDPKEGLPEDPERTIRIHGKHLNGGDTITVFPIGAASLAVRGGFAELGSSFHHARIYRYPAGRKTAYGMMRVYTVDLQKFRDQDLFEVELAPQTITRRYAEPKLRQALDAGTAEYLGWLVTDDELLVKTDAFNTGHLAQAQEEVGTISRWRLDGLFNNKQLRLRPLQLSAEGLSEDASEGLRKTVDRPGWLPAVNKFFERGTVVVIRRDALGRPRLESTAHLPVTWQAGV